MCQCYMPAFVYLVKHKYILYLHQKVKKFHLHQLNFSSKGEMTTVLREEKDIIFLVTGGGKPSQSSMQSFTKGSGFEGVLVRVGVAVWVTVGAGELVRVVVLIGAIVGSIVSV